MPRLFTKDASGGDLTVEARSCRQFFAVLVTAIVYCDPHGSDERRDGSSVLNVAR